MSATFPIGKRFVFLPRQLPKKKERGLPSLGRRAVNFGKAIVRNKISQLSGNPRAVSEATKLARREKCKANSCGNYRLSDDRCAKCGCPTSKRGIIESKTELFAEFCPVGLWGPGETKQ